MSENNPQQGAPDEDQPRGELVYEEGGRQFGMALLAGLIVALIIGGGVYLWVHHSNVVDARVAATPLPMGPDEQAYVPHISFTEMELTRTRNFLKQEVTYVDGQVTNDGPREIVEMEVTLRFHDISQNVILVKTQRFFGSKETPLAAGTKRPFELGFEDIPPTWNQAPPDFLVDGLKLK
jgi:hypothetical protein